MTWTYLSNAADCSSWRRASCYRYTYTVTIDDVHGGTMSQLVTITITAAAVISGDGAGAVVEARGVANGAPGVPTDGGDLDATDMDDDPDDAWEAVTAGTASVYTLTVDGVWSYTLDNANAPVQTLNVGSAPLTDSFTALTADGTPQTVTITVTVTNDAAVISGDSRSMPLAA